MPDVLDCQGSLAARRELLAECKLIGLGIFIVVMRDRCQGLFTDLELSIFDTDLEGID